MIKFGRDKVLLLHQLMIAETGGSADVRDLGLLDSALESAYAMDELTHIFDEYGFFD